MIKTIAYGVPKLRNANVLDNLDESRFGYGEFREVILPELADDEVLVRNFAAGINYNSIWSALRKPADPFSLLENYVKRNPRRSNHLTDFQIIGSDSAGVVERIGKSVADWKVGDEVVVTTGQGVHAYEVIDITVRSARDTAAFQGEGHMLILATVVDSSDRLVVRATLTSPVFPAGQAIDHQTTLDELGLAGDSSSWSDLTLWMLLAALLAAGFPIIVNLVGRRVGWLLVSPIAMWVTFEVWTVISVMSPSAW